MDAETVDQLYALAKAEKTLFPAPTGLLPLSNYRLMDHYLEFVSNENQLATLRTRFEVYTGPVTNTSGGLK